MVIEKDLAYVAKESGICQRTLHEWINGRTTPDYLKLLKVTEVVYEKFSDFAVELEKARNVIVKPAELAAENLKTNRYIVATLAKNQRQSRKNKPKKG